MERVNEIVVTVEVETNKKTMRSLVVMQNDETYTDYLKRIESALDGMLDRVRQE